jgi:hypothetical protein
MPDNEVYVERVFTIGEHQLACRFIAPCPMGRILAVAME